MSVATGDPIRLYDGPAPGSEHWTHQERRSFSDIFQTEVVTNVVVPTLTPVLPAAPGRTAVVVAPGGGFHALSIESEGFEVARWLAERGVAAFVLAYRLVPGGADPVAELVDKLVAGTVDDDMSAIAPLAAADGEAAMRLVRARAPQWGIEADRVGMVGFSAGGNVAVRVAFSADPGARPSFVAPIYAAVRGLEHPSPPPGTGPAFIVAATDDQLGLAGDSIALYERWRAAGLSAELHLYARGGHGFGMRRQGLPSDTWIERFDEWLSASGWC
jgi:acetyl esterase/lipase